jgi:secreted trypsin-like serine protease
MKTLFRATITVLIATLLATLFGFTTEAVAVTYPGQGVANSAAPWSVQLLVDNLPGDGRLLNECTGIVIDPYFILTAAHCIDPDLTPESYIIGIKGSNVSDVQFIQVLDYMVNPSFTFAIPDPYGDIAILRLATSIDVTPISLTPPDDGALRSGPLGLALYGWGVDELDNPPNHLGYAHLVEFTNSLEKWYPHYNSTLQIASGASQISGASKSSACGGDSGGPLIGYDDQSQPFLVGIVSYGMEGCPFTIPDIYTRVVPYLSWIATSRQTLDSRVSARVIYFDSLPSISGKRSSNKTVKLKYAEIKVDSKTTTIIAALAVKDFKPKYKYTQDTDIDVNADNIAEARVTADGVFRTDNGLQVKICDVTTHQTRKAGFIFFSTEVPNDCISNNIGITSDYKVSLTATSPPGKIIGFASIKIVFVTIFS